MQFNHGEHTIDPRDENVVTYNKDKKLFITEYSDLECIGVTTQTHVFTIGGPRECIYLWSEKIKFHVPYKFNRHIMNGDEIAGDIFLPEFSMVCTDKEFAAQQASLGTELHILND